MLMYLMSLPSNSRAKNCYLTTYLYKNTPLKGVLRTNPDTKDPKKFYNVIGIGTRSWEITYMGSRQLECSLLSAM
jgi:hypothetical protein